MPASYTHYDFGQAVYKKLSKEVKAVINDNKEAYNIGLNGPDILFYYKPLSKNFINRFGHEMHREEAARFFNNAKKHIVEHKEGIPYILGFICHFILDSNCHPYIEDAISRSGVSHGEIEAELDGRIMRKSNLSPQSVNAGAHIIPTRKNARIISLFYEKISEGEIFKALKSVRFYNELLMCQNDLKRKMIKGGLSKIKGGESFSHMIINVVPNPNCKSIIDKLLVLYDKSTDEAVQMIEEYYRNLTSDAPISERFNRNFG
ncbi:zinc dependent phospholipase C family protein [Clostridium culturomicium]|uniref:zinc dependent phospholipase C family protein n=1 Tax=Clostridium culturomicium TaxID=1499683 RepID=UPI000590EF5E|nr:zinc dependent phospholipase C family protein [Clostridium culturomicium]